MYGICLTLIVICNFSLLNNSNYSINFRYKIVVATHAGFSDTLSRTSLSAGNCMAAEQDIQQQ